MTQRRFWALLVKINGELAQAQSLGMKEPTVRLRPGVVQGYVPHWYTEEAKSQEEWFIRTLRRVGLHARVDPDSGMYVVRWTRDAADEMAIAWPGRFKDG